MEDFYSLKQIQTVIKPRFYSLPCQFLMKIKIVINPMCACVRIPAQNGTSKTLKGEGEGRGARGWEDMCA